LQASADSKEKGIFIKCKMRKNYADSSNENKMSDGGRGRASLGLGVWKSS